MLCFLTTKFTKYSQSSQRLKKAKTTRIQSSVYFVYYLGELCGYIIWGLLKMFYYPVYQVITNFIIVDKCYKKNRIVI